MAHLLEQSFDGFNACNRSGIIDILLLHHLADAHKIFCKCRHSRVHLEAPSELSR